MPQGFGAVGAQRKGQINTLYRGLVTDKGGFWVVAPADESLKAGLNGAADDFKDGAARGF